MNVQYNYEKHCFECNVNDVWLPITSGYDESSLYIPTQIDRYRLEVALTCNLKCRYCVVHMNNVSQQNTNMSMGTAVSIVEKFNNEVGEKGSIFLMGGEPLTNIPVVKYIIENAKGSSIIFTNALFLRSDLIDFFYRHGTYILTSLDGYNYEQNKKRFWPHVEKNFELVTANIKKAIERGCNVGVSCLLHKDNICDAVKIAEYFRDELRAKAMSFSYPHSTVEHSEESDFIFSDYTEQLKRLYIFSKNNKIYVDQIAKIVSCLYGTYPALIGCKAGTTQRTFYPDGSETICTKIDTLCDFDVNQYIQDLPFQNVSCRKCKARYLCTGECPWDYAVASLKNEKHERVCAFKRDLVSYIISDICSELSRANSVEEARLILKQTFLPMIKNL